MGKASDDDSIDVLVQVPSGRFLQYWPQGKPKTNRELWEKRLDRLPGEIASS